MEQKLQMMEVLKDIVLEDNPDLTYSKEKIYVFTNNKIIFFI
jgi:hypothetical protein